MFIKAKRKAMGASAMLAATMLASAPLHAQSAAPSDSAMVNLVRLLVEQGVLTKDKGDALMRQAETEAAQARAASPPVQQAGTLPPPAAGAIRVPYVPESVRVQIRDEVKTEVLAQAKAEGWAAPGDASPDWVRRLRLYGDIRVRSQSELYSDSNSNLIPDFARINAIGPLPLFERDTFLPLLNTRVDRASRLQLRARLGVEATISEQLTAGLMLATGDTNSPISTNESLGGGFAKRDIWLQEAYLSARPTPWSRVTLGRFANPFLSTGLLFDEDLSFDGAFAEVTSGDLLGDRLGLTLRGGAFPLNFGDPNFPQDDIDKRSFPERWLFSGQVELKGQIGAEGSFRVGAAYHSYTNLQANLSDPCFIYRVQEEFQLQVQCSTDDERAQFLRKGNTVFPIRDIVLDVPPPATNEIRVAPQFVGLALDYNILNLTGQITYPVGDGFDVSILGDYAKNLGFKRRDLCRFGPDLSAAYPPLNNVGADGDGNVCSRTNPSSFVGGDTGYMARITLGHRLLDRWGKWRVYGGYRYLESDAVLDSFSDSDFYLGGTNNKGYFLGAQAYLMRGMTVGARWLSGNEIAAEPFALDVLQVDLQVAF